MAVAGFRVSFLGLRGSDSALKVKGLENIVDGKFRDFRVWVSGNRVRAAEFKGFRV